MFIYADNAAATKMSKAAISAMLPYLDEIYANPSSPHSAGINAAEALANARERMAALLGCSASEIVFTSGGSEADNQALLSAAELGKRQGKRHIISTKVEHHAVLNTLEKLKTRGFDVQLLDVSREGSVTAEQIASAIREDTCLVSVMYANNEIGTIFPAAEIGAVCREKGVLFHTDAVAAAGHLRINVREQNIDMLSLSAHKFGGAKGAGALYCRGGIELTSIIEGGAQESGKRAGTENVPAIMAMAAAFEEACDSIDSNNAKLKALCDKLIRGLSRIPRSALSGSREHRLAGNVHFCFEGIEGESLLLLLDAKGICASSGSACASASREPSHVLRAIGVPPETARGSLRLSLSADNTEGEADYLLKAVTEAVDYLRGLGGFA